MAQGIFGVSSLTYDGVPLNVEGDVTIEDSEPQVDSTADVHGNVFLMLKGKAAKVTAALIVSDPKGLQELRRKRNGTLVAACHNGQTFILRGAAAVGPWSFNMMDGKVSGEFVGKGEWDGV